LNYAEFFESSIVDNFLTYFTICGLVVQIDGIAYRHSGDDFNQLIWYHTGKGQPLSEIIGRK